ncbi:MAG: PEP-utilizing enzyme [Candidatus Diapherotrites archaeon]|nr:PEP-utilizing enzyme [Candidatus Diapherotrites archaeon]
MALKWLELAHEKRGHIYPSSLYWLSAQHVCKGVGVTGGVIGCWYKNHEFSYMSQEGGLSNAGKKILEKLKADKSFLRKIVAVNETEIPVMLEAARGLSGKQLKELSGAELFKRWQNWLESFLRLMTWSAMGTVLEMEEPLLSKELGVILAKKLGKGNEKAGEYFQVLTTAAEQTIAKKEEIDLLQLRRKQLQAQASEEDIAEHTNKYSWIAFGYDGPGWSKEDLEKRLNGLPSDAAEIGNLIDERETAGEKLKEQQAKIEKELGLSQQQKHLFLALRTLGFWKFERKFMNQKAHALMEDFIREIARRNDLSIEQAKMIAEKEMSTVLVQGIVDAALLDERIKESVIVFKGMDYEVLSGEKAKPVLLDITESLKVDSGIRELHGSTAFPGYAKGFVKRIDSPEEMGKMNKGDILVSASTSPDMLPAMGKAAAIITDSGGITCHAAIVARELRIPTLVGTKFASKILKDNDLVEVEAGKGFARKLEKG